MYNEAYNYNISFIFVDSNKLQRIKRQPTFYLISIYYIKTISFHFRCWLFKSLLFILHFNFIV